MAGTSAGGRKAARNAKEKYGKDFFKITGKLGGNPILLKQGNKEKANDFQ